ncbi:uncharacterized protein LOC125475436 [Pyrus x bretschneideri]|uniref:uncharacterized protein LOC125475436 n=1 Tax=Pyrus x bretschneideri TaxID=225117 RepID=UPI00202FE6F4|nr:uncharacterized protein LOC125475436 [Pyrus x bretschneideri]
MRKEFRGDKNVRAVKLQAVRADFEYMRMTDGENLDDYLARFFGIVNNLKSLGEDVFEKMIVQKLLISLSRRYKSIMSIIKETRDLDTIKVEEVIASIKVYDKREDLHDERDKLIETGKVFSSLKVGNNQATGTYKGSQRKAKCGKCNRFGHIANDYDSHKQVANCAKEEEVTTGTMFYACHSSIMQDRSVWFVDIACSNYMTSQESVLINIDISITCKVKMGTRDLVQAIGKGTLVVKTQRGKRYINEVLLQ